MFKPKIVDGQDFTNCSICETVIQLCFAMDLLTGLKITRAKGSNSLQPKGGAAGK